MKVVAFLPVKGSSSRIENKNTALLDGKPLFLHTLEKLLDCGFLDEVYLDSESEQIIAMADHLPCRVLRRDPALASNSTDGNRLFLNEVEQVEADVYVQILCTSPFIAPETIRAGIEAVRSGKGDSAVLISREKQYRWDDKGPLYDVAHIPNSADLPDSLVETMGLYVVAREAALATRRRIGDTPVLLTAEPLEAVDVNWPADFELANLIAAGKREKDRILLNNIGNQLSSCMLSDILDDMGVSQVIVGLKPNFGGARVFGRAKTLRIRALREGEDYRGIYDTLGSYRTIVPNDVIVVENEISDFAYFGELNANLAIRAGASGAIIGGMTRDSADVAKLGFPVFSQGSRCRDVRRRGTVDSMNKPVSICGLTVRPGDLVYADGEGVVVIPRALEAEVLDRAFRAALKEKSVLLETASGIDVGQLVARNGEF